MSPRGNLPSPAIPKSRIGRSELTEDTQNAALEERYDVLKDPDLPAEMRAEIKKQIAIAEEEMAGQKKGITEALGKEYTEELKWAEIAMSYVPPYEQGGHGRYYETRKGTNGSLYRAQRGNARAGGVFDSETIAAATLPAAFVFLLFVF